MFKLFSLVVSALLVANVTHAKPISNFAQKTDGIQVWDADNDFTPVYYGAVLSGRDVNGTAIHACLALGFTRVADGQVHYMHKMWAPQGGQCYYTSTSAKTKYIVDNQTVCSPDSDRKGKLATRVMSPENMKALPFGQRIVDFNAGYAGQYTRCPYFSSQDPSLDSKERSRLPVLKGFNDSLFTAAQGVAAAGAQNVDPQTLQMAQIQGAFENIHGKALASAGKNYWGIASLVDVGQQDGYFYMITNGLGHGLVYKVNLNYRNTAVEAAPLDNEINGKYF